MKLNVQIIRYVYENVNYILALIHHTAKNSYFLKEDLGITPHPFPKINFLNLSKLYKLFSIILPLTTGASKIVSFILMERLVF